MCIRDRLGVFGACWQNIKKVSAGTSGFKGDLESESFENDVINSIVLGYNNTSDIIDSMKKKGEKEGDSILTIYDFLTEFDDLLSQQKIIEDLPTPEEPGKEKKSTDKRDPKSKFTFIDSKSKEYPKPFYPAYRVHDDAKNDFLSSEFTEALKGVSVSEMPLAIHDVMKEFALKLGNKKNKSPVEVSIMMDATDPDNIWVFGNTSYDPVSVANHWQTLKATRDPDNRYVSFHNHPNFKSEIHSALSGKDVHNLLWRPGQYSSTAMITGDMSPNFAYTIKPTKKTQATVGAWLSNPYHKEPPDFSKLYNKYIDTSFEKYLESIGKNSWEVGFKPNLKSKYDLHYGFFASQSTSIVLDYLGILEFQTNDPIMGVVLREEQYLDYISILADTVYQSLIRSQMFKGEDGLKSFTAPVKKSTGGKAISQGYGGQLYHRPPGFIRPGPLAAISYGFERTTYEFPGEGFDDSGSQQEYQPHSKIRPSVGIRQWLADHFGGSETKERRVTPKNAEEKFKQDAGEFTSVHREINEIISRIVPNVNIEIIPEPGNNKTGFYADGLIQVALNPSANKTALHEAIHALHDLGLFTPEEWRTLSQAAETSWVKKHNIQELYPEMFWDDGTPTQDAIEEAIAEEFANWQESSPPKKMKLFERIADFFKQFREFLAKKFKGQRSAEDILDDAYAGKVGARESKNKPSATQSSTVEETDQQIRDRFIGTEKNKRKNFNFMTSGRSEHKAFQLSPYEWNKMYDGIQRGYYNFLNREAKEALGTQSFLQEKNVDTYPDIIHSFLEIQSQNNQSKDKEDSEVYLSLVSKPAYGIDNIFVHSTTSKDHSSVFPDHISKKVSKNGANKLIEFHNHPKYKDEETISRALSLPDLLGVLVWPGTYSATAMTTGYGDNKFAYTASLTKEYHSIFAANRKLYNQEEFRDLMLQTEHDLFEKMSLAVEVTNNKFGMKGEHFEADASKSDLMQSINLGKTKEDSLTPYTVSTSSVAMVLDYLGAIEYQTNDPIVFDLLNNKFYQQYFETLSQNIYARIQDTRFLWFEFAKLKRGIDRLSSDTGNSRPSIWFNQPETLGGIYYGFEALTPIRRSVGVYTGSSKDHKFIAKEEIPKWINAVLENRKRNPVTRPAKVKERRVPKFDDPEIEKRWQEASKGVKSDIIGRFKEGFTQQWKRLTRAREYLPQKKELADIHEKLVHLEQSEHISKESISSFFQKVMGDLSPNEIDLLTRKMVLDDLLWTSEQGLDLPFGLKGVEDVAKALADVEAVIEKDAKLLKRLAIRTQKRNQLRKHMIREGVLTEEQANNPSYFRHQILEYSEIKARAEAGAGKIKSTYWNPRRGYEGDINANYFQAEADWMFKAYRDIATAKFLNYLRGSKYNVKEKVVQQAKEENTKKLKELIVKDESVAVQYEKLTRNISISLMALRRTLQKYGVNEVKKKIGSEHESALDQFMDGGGNRSVLNQSESSGFFNLIRTLADSRIQGVSRSAGMTLGTTFKRRAFIKKSLGEDWINPMNMESLVNNFLNPDEYSVWQPDAYDGKQRKIHIFTGKTIGEHVIDNALDNLESIVGNILTKKEVDEVKKMLGRTQQVRMLGGPMEELILDKRISETLNNFYDTEVSSVIDGIGIELQSRYALNIQSASA